MRLVSAHPELAAEHLAKADQLIAASRHRDALGYLKAAIGADPSHATAQRASALVERLDASADLTAIGVAFLSDHTVGPLPPLVRAAALLSDLLVRPYDPDFDVWLQEI